MSPHLPTFGSLRQPFRQRSNPRPRLNNGIKVEWRGWYRQIGLVIVHRIAQAGCELLSLVTRRAVDLRDTVMGPGWGIW